VPQTTEVPAVDIARSLANIHQICVTNLEDLQKISQKKVTACDLLISKKTDEQSFDHDCQVTVAVCLCRVRTGA